MESSDKSFNIVGTPADSNDALLSGHGTAVRRFGTLSGRDAVEKTVKSGGAYKTDPTLWCERTVRAKQISDEVRAKNNPAYFVPKTFISNGKVYEQFANGAPIVKVDSLYEADYIGELNAAIGNFINDMTELRPARHKKSSDSVPGIRIKNISELKELLSGFKGALPDANLKTVADAWKLLRDLPENKVFVFAHRDLHGENILLDTETGQVAIIDFEMAGFQSQFAAMYQYGTISSAELWNLIDHLPRAKNPDLHWDYDKNKFSVHRFLIWATDGLNFLHKNSQAENYDAEFAKFAKDFDAASRKAGFQLGDIKLNDARLVQAQIARRQNGAALVPTAHYRNNESGRR